MAHVVEITGHVDVSAYPAGTRVLVRREPLHPGAQQTFDDIDGHRYTALLTTQQDADLAALDRRHRAHAHMEQRIRDAKTLGLRNLPSADFAINRSGCNSCCSPKTCSPGSPAHPRRRPGRGHTRDRALPAVARRRTHHPQRPPCHAASRRRLAVGRRPRRGVPETSHRVPARVTATRRRQARREDRGGPHSHVVTPSDRAGQADARRTQAPDRAATRNHTAKTAPPSDL